MRHVSQDGKEVTRHGTKYPRSMKASVDGSKGIIMQVVTGGQTSSSFNLSMYTHVFLNHDAALLIERSSIIEIVLLAVDVNDDRLDSRFAFKKHAC